MGIQTGVTNVRAALDTVAPDIARGLRAAVATVVPFYLSGVLNQPELAWMALGGWLGSLADPGGSRRSRVVGMLVFAVVGGALIAIAEGVSGWPWLAAALLGIAAFATSLFRAVGGWGSSVGTVLLIATAVAASATGGVPLRDGLFFLVGGSWAMLLSSMVWPVWTHRPVRRAIANSFSELGAYAAALSACAREAVPIGHERWGETARKHQRAVRSAIEQAREIAVALRTRRSGESRLGGNLRMLIGNGEVEFFTLIALGEEIETLADPEERQSVARVLDHHLRTCEEIRDRLFIRNVTDDARAMSEGPKPGVLGPAGVLTSRLIDASRVALIVARAPHEVTVQDEDDSSSGPRSPMSDVDPAIESLRDALSPRSPLFRHAVRVMFTAVAAFVIGREISPGHVPWVTISAILVLQPYPGATLDRALERVVGTVLGSVAAVVLMIALHTPWALALAMFPLSTAAIVTRPRSYRLFTFFLTPVFVLFADRGQDDWWTAAARAGDAVVGGLVALTFAMLVFPSWERKRLAQAMGAVVDALSAYAETMFDIFERGHSANSSAETSAARRALGIALGEAETSLERMLAEPRRSPWSAAHKGGATQRRAENALQLITYARRLSAALTALDLQMDPTHPRHQMDPTHQMDPRQPHDVAHRAELARRLRSYVTAILGALSALSPEVDARAPEAEARAGDAPSLVPEPPVLPPNLPAPWGAALSRVLRHAELVASLLGRPSRA